MAFFYFFAFLFGTVFGSFLSVIIHRLPNDESIVQGRSQCPHCHHTLSPLELIPLVSYIGLRGRCKQCHAPISVVYPLLEVGMGLLFVLALVLTVASGQSSMMYLLVTWIYYCAIFTLLLGLFFIDLFYQLLLDILVFPAFLIAIAYDSFLYWFFVLQHHAAIVLPQLALSLKPLAITPAPIHTTILSPILFGYAFGIGTAVFFLLLLLATRGRGMGGGDVKYALVLGAVTGWPSCVLALFAAFVGGAVISLFLLITGKKKMGNVIPFGPFLIAATILAMVIGNQLVDIYLHTVLP